MTVDAPERNRHVNHAPHFEMAVRRGARPVVMLLLIFAAVMAMALWKLHQHAEEHYEAMALQGAEIQLHILTQSRHKCPDGDPSQKSVNSDDETYASAETGPWIAHLAERLRDARPGADIYFYSNQTITGRKRYEPRDDFQREALERLTRQPNQPFYRFETFAGRPVLRYAVAERLSADCKKCQQQHTDNSQRDRKEDRLTGVLEFVRPLDNFGPVAVYGTRRQLFGTIAWVVGGCALTVIGFALATVRLQITTALLKHNIKQMQTLLETAPDGVVAADANGRIFLSNPAAEKMLGYEPGGLHQQALTDIIPERRKKSRTGELESFLSSGEHGVVGRIVEMPALHRDGREVPVELRISAAGSGPETSYIAILRDVTERRRASQERDRLVRAIECSADAILLTDLDGTIRYANPAFESLTGYVPREVLGRTPRFLRSGRHDAAYYQNIWTTIKSGKTWSGKVINRRKDGGEYDAALTISPVVDDQRRISGYVGVQRDVTLAAKREEELRRYAAALETTNNALEEATRAAEDASVAKSQFLANMSHEIRTPLTAILGYADLLIDDAEIAEQPEARCETARSIRQNGEHLLQLINDILDLSKIEAGRLTIEKVPCSPLQIAADVASVVRVRADAKRIDLSVKCFGSIPETIETDPIRLRQILINLVGNAVKFTEKGGVRLEFRLLTGEAPMMQFDVIDTGIGVHPEQAELLFKPFTQADNSTARRFGGTGLGLSISRRLAHMLGGDVVLFESRQGGGSHFRATIAAGSIDGVKMYDSPDITILPSQQSGDRADPTSAAAPLSDLRILVAEDGPDNQRLIAHLLRRAGAEVTLAENGQDAIDTIHAAAGSRPFDLILMDMQMPVLDGYEATARLRAEGHCGPIIALTAHAMRGDRERCLAAGCDAYASKPIDRNALFNTIITTLRASTAERTQAEPSLAS